MFERFFSARPTRPRDDRERRGARAAFNAVQRLMRRPPAIFDPLTAAEHAGAMPDPLWRSKFKRRVVCLLCALGVWTVGVEARLVELQVVRHKEMLARALDQQQRVVKLVPQRGDIVDRHGEVLAYSVDGSAIVADPAAIDDPTKAADEICDALRDCDASKRTGLEKSLSRKTMFAYVDRQVGPDQVRRVEALKLPGIRTIPEPRRYYPNLDLAAHVLGFVGIDNEGLGGIERSFNKVIRGRPGEMLLEVDARRKRLDSRIQQAPVAGATVELTLDLYLQHIAERELRAGVEKTHADGGTAVVMDPHTGEILAMASYPAFNPNDVQSATDAERRNRAIQDIYEPGSTFKIVTASAAFQEGVMSVDDLIDTNPGRINFGSRVVREDNGHDYGVLSFADVIVKSSNVGAIKIGLKVGPERMERYIRRYGFGQALLPDLGGQSAGIVWDPVKLSDSALASMSMGYQVGVTPLQMVNAVSAVANGGTLYQPHLVRAVIRGNDRQEIAPKPLWRVINPDTAATLTSIMEGVVQRGTGKEAQLAGYRVAGKTGTAAKLVDGHYSHTDYNVSFVGFVPASRPVLAILVLVDTPRNGSPYGGTVAAPIFKQIAEAALRQLGVPPTINPPPVVLAEAGTANPPLTDLADTKVVPPDPDPTRLGGSLLMPDVRGLNARQALRALSGVGLTVRLLGSGLVAAQTPEPGTPVELGGSSQLELHRAVGGGPRE